MSNPVISCKNITKKYSEFKDDVSVLEGVNFDIQKGQKVAILGLSGSGKTTLLNLLGGLDDPTSGEILLMGNKLNGISKKLD
jgi:lipoprotein-releasing system ATP-binding protein